MQKKFWVNLNPKYKKKRYIKTRLKSGLMSYWRPYIYHLNKPETQYFLGISNHTGNLTCHKKVDPNSYLKWLTKMSVWDRITYNSTRLVDWFKFVPVFFLKKRYPWKRKNLINQIRFNKGKFPASEILHDLAKKKKFPWWKVHFLKNWEKNRINWIWNIPTSNFYENSFKEERNTYVLNIKKYLKRFNILKQKITYTKHKCKNNKSTKLLNNQIRTNLYNAKFIKKIYKYNYKNKKYSKKKNKYNYISNFWMMYKSNAYPRDFLNTRKRYFYHNIEIENMAEEELCAKAIPTRAPLNFLYKIHFIGHKKKRLKAFSLPRRMAKQMPWLIPLMCNRKLYKINRKRTYKREKLFWKVRKFWWHTQYFRWSSPKKNAIRGKKFPRFTRILMKYIMWPYLGSMKQRQAQRFFKKLRRIHSLQNSLLCNFENRLDFLACQLGFAPSVYWSRIFILMGWIWVSNSKELEVCKNTALPFLSTKTQGVKFYHYTNNSINCNKKFINMFVEIKTSLWCKILQKEVSQQLVLPEFYMTKSKYQQIRTSPLHIVKHHEMIHISPFLKKRLAFWFMNKFRKKHIRWYIEWNADKTVALIHEYNNLHHGEKNTERLDKKYFTVTYLMAQR